MKFSGIIVDKKKSSFGYDDGGKRKERKSLIYNICVSVTNNSATFSLPMSGGIKNNKNKLVKRKRKRERKTFVPHISDDCGEKRMNKKEEKHTT